MIDWLTDPNTLAALATLIALEVVLGIDNLVFLSIVVDRLPAEARDTARKVGLGGALVMRLVMLAGVFWLTALTKPLFVVLETDISWRDIILIAGGLFLLVKGTLEIHHEVEGGDEVPGIAGAVTLGMTSAIVQIMLLDLVFSIDSIVTAVGMTRDLPVMFVAVIVAVLVMLFASRPVGEFIRRHPTAKMLALSFLLLVGVALIADGFDVHIPRGYLYFAIFFSIFVESLNIIAKRRRARARDGDA